MVVVVKEPGAEGPGILDRAEPLREGGEVFEGLEAGFRVWVVVGDVGAGVAAGHPRSKSSWATGPEVIDDPRSAWMVPGAWPLRVMAEDMRVSTTWRRSAGVRALAGAGPVVASSPRPDGHAVSDSGEGVRSSV